MRISDWSSDVCSSDLRRLRDRLPRRGFRMTSPVWHPFTQHGLGEPIPTVVRTEGAALHTADGARIVDAISSWWVTTHGHRHPAIMAAIAEATESLDQIGRAHV